MKRYKIIYADPPWSYNDKRGADKVGAKHGGRERPLPDNDKARYYEP